MKQLTFSAMAAARLRANKRQYLSLVLGIFLSVFLVSSLILGVYGIYLAFLQQRYELVGYVDMVVLDSPDPDPRELEELDLFESIGTIRVSGVVTDRNVYVGYYDDTAIQLVNLVPVEGRLPQEPGQIAVERSALEILEVDWSLGEQVELDITPMAGTRERRSYTVVGFLPERTEAYQLDNLGLSQLPAIVTSSGKPDFSVGHLDSHYVMGLRPSVSLNQGLDVLGDWAVEKKLYSNYFGLSVSGQQQRYSSPGNAMDANRDMYRLMLTAFALAAALVLSCGVGISGAMEGLLSQRREEIGVIRALGATRRQIRRMFGRENLILALVMAPLSLGGSCLAVWGLSRLLPGQLVFGFRLWLLAPIGIFSVLVILLAGWLPLVRSSRLMPMSVIRDTAMLRRSKALRYRKTFSPARLISTRQFRLHPTRQLGAALLVGLMLLCAGLFPPLLREYYRESTQGDYPGFHLFSHSGMFSKNHVNQYIFPSISRQSIGQLKGLPHVESVRVDRNATITAILPEVPRYAMLNWGTMDNFGMLDDAQFQEAMAFMGSSASYYEQDRETTRAQYLQFLKDQRIQGQAFDLVLITLDLDRSNLAMLESYLESGKIRPEAINAGQEVIVVAPSIWALYDDSGGYQAWSSEELAKEDPAARDAQLVAWNDVFFAGQQLPLLHLYQRETGGEIFREDANVTVGAVVSGMNTSRAQVYSTVYLITTEQGLEKMNLQLEGTTGLALYMDGALSAQQEQTLERQITAIARRTPGYSVYNQLLSFRESVQQQRQTAALVAALAFVFFAVSVGMTVSSVTRQLNSEGRTIGMLRAVGADERTILNCYSGSVTASVAGGLLVSLGLLGLFLLGYAIDLTTYHSRVSANDLEIFAIMALSICVMDAVCLAVCRFFLRLRIREIVNKSIIDNIREL